jgi:hypothetical protein
VFTVRPFYIFKYCKRSARKMKDLFPAGLVQNTPFKYIYNSGSLSASFKTFHALLTDPLKSMPYTQKIFI